MGENVPQHTHCHVCMKAIPFGETLCSEECRQKYRSMLKRRKLMLYFMYGMLVALLVVVILYNRI
jgi:predicted nucleic acid-binding Zn ribbon protein